MKRWNPRKTRERPVRTVKEVTALLAVLFFGTAVFAQSEQARVTGSLRDEQDKPLAGVKLAFVPTDPQGVRQEAETNKKGKFTIGSFLPGMYTPVIDSPDLLLMSVRFSARAPDGQRLGSFEEDNVRERGIPAFSVLAFSRVTVDLVATQASTEEEPGGEIAAAADPTGKLKALNALFELNRWEDLVAESAQVLADNPELGGAVYLRGVGLWRVGRLPEAVTALRRAVGLLPEQQGIHGVLGSLLLERAMGLKQQGDEEQALARFGEAADALTRQLERTPDSGVHLNNLVIALDGAGRSDEAMGALERLIAAAPGRTEVYVRLAELMTDAKRPDDALEILGRAPEPGRNVAIGIYNAAVLLWNQKRNEETIAAMDRALAIYPDEPMLRRLRGRALIAAGRIEEGLADLKTFLGMAPDHPMAEGERQLVEALEEQEG